ncbi:MAG: hypothetical protein ACW974_08265 [Candidatus Thorarchaeota archaeon]
MNLRSPHINPSRNEPGFENGRGVFIKMPRMSDGTEQTSLDEFDKGG